MSTTRKRWSQISIRTLLLVTLNAAIFMFGYRLGYFAGLDTYLDGLDRAFGAAGTRMVVRETDNPSIICLTTSIPPVVEGRISNVSQHFPGLVEINLGSDDGTRKGHELDVYRDATYLGRVTVLKTRTNFAVAKIDQDLLQGPFSEGDHVSSKFRG